MSITSKNLVQLQAALQIAGIEKAATVAEYRCASARHIAGLSFKSYHGFDERAAYLDQARQRFPNQKFTQRAPRGTESAELFICLDLAGALPDHPSFESLIKELSLAATHALLVGGECVSTALLSDDPAVTLDVAGELRRTEEFEYILPLTRHGGRELFLALKPAAVVNLVADGPTGLRRLLDASPYPAQLLLALLSARATKCVEPNEAGEAMINAPSLFEHQGILRLLGEDISQSHIGLVGTPRSPIGLTITSTGAKIRCNSAEQIPSHSIKDSEVDTWIIERNGWPKDPERRADILDNASRMLAPGGSLILAFDLRKRTNDIVATNDQGLSLEALVRELESKGYLILNQQIFLLPFNIVDDLALIRAIYLGKGTVRKKQKTTLVGSRHRKSRPPKLLRDLKRKIKNIIRGTKNE